MSDQDLYEIARQRIDKRIRRWTIWSINLAVLVLMLAAQVVLGDTEYAEISAAVFLAWGGIFAMHTIMTAFAESRDSQIESEVTKLRSALSTSAAYEKPKRLELTDDGELTPVEHGQDSDGERARVARHS